MQNKQAFYEWNKNKITLTSLQNYYLSIEPIFNNMRSIKIFFFLCVYTRFSCNIELKWAHTGTSSEAVSVCYYLFLAMINQLFNIFRYIFICKHTHTQNFYQSQWTWHKLHKDCGYYCLSSRVFFVTKATNQLLYDSSVSLTSLNKTTKFYHSLIIKLFYELSCLVNWLCIWPVKSSSSWSSAWMDGNNS